MILPLYCALSVTGSRKERERKGWRGTIGMAFYSHLPDVLECVCVCVCVGGLRPSSAVPEVFNAAERDVTRRAVTLVWPSVLS